MFRNVVQGLDPIDVEVLASKLSERRRQVRVRCYCRVKVTTSEGDTFRATVTDIGIDGMRLRSPIGIKPRSKLVIEYAHGEAEKAGGDICCEVVWVNKVANAFVAGVVYRDTAENRRRSWVMSLLQELGFDESKTFQRRRHIRAEGMIPARLFYEGDRIDGMVVNLGLGGALMEGEADLTEGTSVELSMCLWRILPALNLKGTLLNCRSESISERFLYSIKFSELSASQLKLLGNYVIYLINQTSPLPTRR